MLSPAIFFGFGCSASNRPQSSLRTCGMAQHLQHCLFPRVLNAGFFWSVSNPQKNHRAFLPGFFSVMHCARNSFFVLLLERCKVFLIFGVNQRVNGFFSELGNLALPSKEQVRPVHGVRIRIRIRWIRNSIWNFDRKVFLLKGGKRSFEGHPRLPRGRGGTPPSSPPTPPDVKWFAMCGNLQHRKNASHQLISGPHCQTFSLVCGHFPLYSPEMSDF